ncbi:102_t:CDS:2, partial [Funneliformis mosseae]
LTTWKKKANVVKCSTENENSRPVFRIYFGDEFDQVLETTQPCTATATHKRSAFKELSNCFYNSDDNPVLKSVTFGVQNKDIFQIDFGKINEDEVKLKRNVKRKLSINNEMQEKIPIYIIKLDHHYSNETLEDASVITDPEVIQIIYESIGNEVL